MAEIIQKTEVKSELLLRSVIMYLKSVNKTETNAEKKLKTKVCIEKIETVLDRMVKEDDTEKHTRADRGLREKKCGTCLFYVRDHNKKGHIKKCRIKRDFYPQPDNESCDSWRSKGIE